MLLLPMRDGASGKGRRTLLGALLAVVLALAASAAGGLAAPAPQGGPESAGSQGAAPELLREVYEAGLEHVDLDRLEELYGLVDEELRARLNVDWGRFLRSMGQEGLPGAGEVLQALASLFVRELVVNAHLLARLLALAVLGAALQQLGRGIGSDAVLEAARAVVMLAMILIGLHSFNIVIRMIGGSVQQMTAIAQALLPTLGGLGALSGVGVATAALHPILLGVLTASGQLLQNVVVPGLVLGGSLAVTGQIATDFPLSRLSGLIQHAALVVLGLTLTVLLGVVAVRGALGPVADGVMLRTAKYVAGATVPVVGRMVSEAVEVVAGGGALIRGGLGLAGVVTVVLAGLAPVVKLLAVVFVFRLASALLEPLGDPRVAGALEAMSDTMGLLLSSLAATVVVFMLATSAMVGASTLPWVVR